MPKKIEVSDDVWTKLRLEYISSSDVSMRGLQKKYGVPFNQIRNRAESEKWLEQREAIKSQSTQKSIDLISDFQAEECSRAFRLASKVMSKLEEVVENIEVDDEYATKNLKNITSAIKDLKEIGVFRSNLDRMEQEARISKLRKDAEEEQKDTVITVQFGEGEDDYAN